jgi:hypothetical protein
MILKSGTGAQIAVEAINDKRLSDGAIATLTYLMSKPVSWKVYCTAIASRYHRNRRTAQKYLDELIELGYAKRNEITRKDGKTTYTYDVSDKPNNIYSVHPVHTSNIKSPAVIVNSEVKHCIDDLQMYMDMYGLIPSEPVQSLKHEIRLIIGAGIIPKIFALYALDWMHGSTGVIDMKAFINEALQILTYADKPKRNKEYYKCGVTYEE